MEPVVELLLERRDLEPEQQHLILDISLLLALVTAGFFVDRHGCTAVGTGGVTRLGIPGKHDMG